jgi:hypothetical protein
MRFASRRWGWRNSGSMAEAMRGELAGLLERHKQQTGKATLPRPERLALRDIKRLPEVFQPRDGITEFHVSTLMKALKVAKDLDPVTIMVSGGRYILVDGHHRFEAYRRVRGAATADIPVKYFDGDPAEAVLVAGGGNAKVYLPMTTRERSNYAWRLTLTGMFSKAQTVKAAVTSDGQVAKMRRVMKTLGKDAGNYNSWFKALTAAERREPKQTTDEDLASMLEERADRIADKLARTFGTMLATDTQVAAMALDRYFGRKLGQLVEDLREHLPDERGFGLITDELDTDGDEAF